MAEFKLDRIRYRWKGSWVATTDYILDDVVNYHGKTYVCLVQHTADPDFYVDFRFYNSDIPPLLVPKWELMVDGYSWTNQWLPDTNYALGEIVRYRGTVYICSIEHTSDTGASGFDTDAMKWTVYLSDLSWTGSWTVITYYGKGDVVKYGGIIYRCTTSHTSATLALGLEDDQGYWEILSFSNSWQGDWVIATRYRTNDIVKYNGIVYKCVIGHTSADNLEDGLEIDNTKWSVVHSGIEYRNDWAATTEYKLNDIVKFGGGLYICTTAHVALATFSPLNWANYLDGFEFEANWGSAVTYQQGDVVRYGGYQFVSITTNINSEPTLTSIDWTLLFIGLRFVGEWDPTAIYILGDLVRRRGQVYACILKTGIGDDVEVNGTTNTTYWELVVPGEQWQGDWVEGVEYVIGDLVNWTPNTYRCTIKHTSTTDNLPDNGNGFAYWTIHVGGNPGNRLTTIGDIKTFGVMADGSSIGTRRLPIGVDGEVLKVVTEDAVWSPLWQTEKAYYVATTGTDDSLHGLTINSPWKTLRHACDNITGTATIFVKSGVYEEILPIRVPAGVAIVGDELRSTEIRPAGTLIAETDISKTIITLDYIKNIIDNVIETNAVLVTYSNVPQSISGTAGSSTISSLAATLIGDMTTVIGGGTVNVTGSNTASVDTSVINSRIQISNNKEFLVQEGVEYIKQSFPLYSFNADRCARDLGLFIDAILYDLLYSGNWKSVDAGKYYLHATDGELNALQNMFLMRDSTGLRNLSCKGLAGEFTALDQYSLRRVTGGAFVALDPGWGPTDTSTWITGRSPYIQNVTTFGSKCVGMRLNGDLHSGGKKSMVANDFTNILDDGIGAWITGDGKTELVSIFTYYNYIGYLAEEGGKIRATNGNNSYGKYGSVAIGSSPLETPITSTLNNHYYQAEPYLILCKNGAIMHLFFDHSGVNYTNATYTVTGSGAGAILTGNEFRDNAVQQARIVDRGDSSFLGGLQYTFNIGQAQQGLGAVLRLAAPNNAAQAAYENQRVFINYGTGIGQYGYIATFNTTSKDITVAQERFSPIAVTATSNVDNGVTIGDATVLSVNQEVVLSGTAFGGLSYGTLYYVHTIISTTRIKLTDAIGNVPISLSTITSGSMQLHRTGWENVKAGEPIEATYDTTTEYYIEPRVTFSSPTYSTAASTMVTSAEWKSVAFGNNVFIAVANNIVNSSNTGTSWDTGTIPAGNWSAVAYGNGRFVAVSSDGKSAYGTTANSFTLTSIPFATYSAIVYGDAVDTWVAVADGGTKAAYSTDNGTTWTAATLPEGADWTSVAYGNGKFVAVAASDSTATQTAYSADGITWSSGSWIGGSKVVKFGNGRFVALGGAGTTVSQYSFDGINWYTGTLPGASANWNTLAYGHGVFVAIATGTNRTALSSDGLYWTSTSAGAVSTWSTATFGLGKFVAIAGVGSSSTVARVINAGATAKGRAIVVDGKVSYIALWDQGSGYTSDPSITIFDNANSADVAIDVRLGDGVLGMPTLTNAGAGYFVESTSIAISGDGYKDEYQIGSDIVVSNLTRLPRPGANLNFGSIDDFTYRVLGTTQLAGAEPNFTARLKIAKALARPEAPEHNESVTILEDYSQVRITGHDFLDIGLGNFIETNYPDTLNPVGSVLSPQNEFLELTGGRVFYTSTDQDGNFRVGELFAVEQSTGIVTLSADFFQLAGLEELALGGISAGGSGVVIREFSTDTKFTADSNNVVPTQRAIKAYISNRVSGGGADAKTNIAFSGIVKVGPDEIRTITGTQLDIPVKMRFLGGISGHYLSSIYFADSFDSGTGE